MAIEVFIGITTAFLIIGSLLIFGATRDPLLAFFGWLKDFFFQFINIMPKWMKLLMFLFFVVFLVGGIINGFLALMFFCDGTTVYQPNNFFTGVAIGIGSVFQNQTEYGNLTESQYKSILNNNTIIYSEPDIMTPEGVWIVRCSLDSPKLTIFGIPIFDYRTWIFLFIMMALFWGHNLTRRK